jgi:hypothetical protein
MTDSHDRLTWSICKEMKRKKREGRGGEGGGGGRNET